MYPHRGSVMHNVCVLFDVTEETVEQKIDAPVIWDASALIEA